jgi:Mu-like prophage I protein
MEKMLFAKKVTLSAGDLPTRVKIAHWGENVGRSQNINFFVNETTLLELPRNQSARARDTVPTDFEHQSERAHPNFKGHPQEFAAHGTIDVVRGEGIFYNPVWSQVGEKFAAQYPDLSPVILINSQREAVLVNSVALTTAGDIDGINLVAASAVAMPNDMIDLVRQLLQLDALTPDESVVKILRDKVNGNNTPSVNASAEEFDKLRDEMCITKHILMATARGVAIPSFLRDATGKYLFNSDQIGRILEDLPATVPLANAATPMIGSSRQLSADEELVRKSLGITIENWSK